MDNSTSIITMTYKPIAKQRPQNEQGDKSAVPVLVTKVLDPFI
jgi:hypothetical protein